MRLENEAQKNKQFITNFNRFLSVCNPSQKIVSVANAITTSALAVKRQIEAATKVNEETNKVKTSATTRAIISPLPIGEF